MDSLNAGNSYREPWNKDKPVGQKVPVKFKEIWAIRVRLQISNHMRDLALFDLAIASLRVQSSCSRRRSDPCSLRSLTRQGRR